MQVVQCPHNLEASVLAGSIVTIGVFDGVHRGHTEVIRTLSEIKRREGGSASVLVTFDRHPLAVTHPEMVPPLLTTLEEKLHVLSSMNIDYTIIERFSADLAGIGYRDYIAHRLVEGLGMKHLVVGYDFHLGLGREGSQERIVEEGRRLGFGVTIVPPMVLQGSVVSSTKIRRDVIERRLDHAARFLGRPFFLEAEVVHGDGRGRGIGFPTANAEVGAEGKLLPPRGVYAVEVEARGRRYGGMMNVGTAPTVRVDGRRRIEVHLFDFDGALHGERIRVHCLHFMREERRFESVEELRAQLMQDRVTARAILEKRH